MKTYLLYLILILSQLCNAQISVETTDDYLSIKDANIILEYYENFLLRSPNVRYLAVIKIPNKNTYGIEIGVTIAGKMNFDPELSIEDILYGNFKENEIPKILPLPYSNNDIIHQELYYKNTRETHESIKIAEILKVEVKEFIKNDSLVDKESNWYNFDYGTHPITGGKDLLGEGTLGGIFMLEEFPNELFGISNWHVLSGKNNEIGSPVYSDINGVLNKIGVVFWNSFDLFREATIVRFDNVAAKKLIEKHLQKILNWRLIEPSIGMNIRSYKYSNSQPHEIPKIHSLNATIRMSDTQYGDTLMRHVFKNQIIVKQFTSGGDSGSLLITTHEGKDAVVGLVHGSIDLSTKVIDANSGVKTKISCYTIANNINDIFNKKFNQKKEVFIEDVDNIRHTYLINQFNIKCSKN